MISSYTEVLFKNRQVVLVTCVQQKLLIKPESSMHMYMDLEALFLDFIPYLPYVFR